MAPQSVVKVEMVRLDLPVREAALFVQFQKHHDKIMTLLESGILDLKNGTATLAFNNDGVLTNIETTKIAFRR